MPTDKGQRRVRPRGTPRSTSKGKRPRPRGFVRPGELLGFAAELKQKKAWPPKRTGGDQHHKGPTMTPYLVVRAFAGDAGVRPINALQAHYSPSVQILDQAGTPVMTPSVGQSYRLRAQVLNRGALGAFAGLANFYVAPPATFDSLATVPGSALPAQGLTGFMALPGQTVTVESPRQWIPASEAEAASSILVQAFDSLIDMIQQPFSAETDRHVGRHDPVPDLSGVWDGMESANPIHQAPTKIRFVITQSGTTVNVGIFSEVGSPPSFPATPQDAGTAQIINGVVHLSTVEVWGPSHQPFTQNDWVIWLTTPTLLHFTHHTHFLMPGDTRPDCDTFGDLPQL
jgi:hypothetical protein